LKKAHPLKFEIGYTVHKQPKESEMTGTRILLLSLLLSCISCWSGCVFGDHCPKDCPRGEVVCDCECVDLMADDDNCGACGVSCEAFKTCIGGVCGA
jgi:hypothetical protein